MKNLHIENSYNIWLPKKMKLLIDASAKKKYDSWYPTYLLNRSYISMFVEWWLHNIGYYITLPFDNIKLFKKTNLRCKDVDLEEWIKRG